MPPASIVHRFCTMLHDILSSQWHQILKPPWVFSTLNVQRGTIIVDGIPVGLPSDVVPIPGTPSPGMPTEARSIIIVLDMNQLLLRCGPPPRARPSGARRLRGDYRQTLFPNATILRGKTSGARRRG